LQIVTYTKITLPFAGLPNKFAAKKDFLVVVQIEVQECKIHFASSNLN
jgi:hypothetical protein